MVAIKSHEAERFLARDAAGFSAFLVFGADGGLVSERARLLIKTMVDDPGDPFQLARLDGDDVAREPGRLVEEAGTIPLFGGRRAVWLEAGSKNIAAAVEQILELADLSPVVIEAGALKKDSPLRKAVERSRRGAAIECNPDEERDILRLIDETVADAGLSIAPEARLTLAALLGADRLASRTELAKLTLFARGADEITGEHVEQIVADASATAGDALVDAAFAGNVPALDAALRKSMTNAAEAGTILGAAARHANFLHRTRVDIDAGGSAEAVLSQLARWGISFKRKAAVERALRLSSDALFRAATRLGEAVGQVRRNPDLAQSLASRALWTVALTARSTSDRAKASR